ncbi:MAG: MauE/DoxX family redox-associated membrane protein, partial [Stackebrandtia sp.]
LAAALLWPQAWTPAAAAAALLGVGFVGYLVYARKVAPESSCGCMSAKHIPISWRGFGRAAWVAVAGATAIAATQSWPGAIAESPWAAAAALLGETALFVGLSPEFDSVWLIPLRRAKVRLTNPLYGGGDASTVPLQDSVTRLHLSVPYQKTFPLLRTDVREYWDEGEWRVICYGARVDGRQATAVFAVPLRRDHPEQIRVALVDEDSQEVLMRTEGEDVPDPLAHDHDHDHSDAEAMAGPVG